MAFIGLLVVIAGMAALLLGVLFFGIALMIVGTILHKKTKYKKLGVTLRIFGYIVFIPTLVITIITIWWINR